MKLWLLEVGRNLAPAGITLTTVMGRDAYAAGKEGNLDELRQAMAEYTTCKADIVVGFTGKPDSETARISASPFAHHILVGVKGNDSDPVAAGLVARAFAALFGVEVKPGNPNEWAMPGGGVIEDSAIRLISRLRRYDFARGIAALPGAWDSRALAALADAMPAGAASRTVAAHRVLARAYVSGGKGPDAISHLRQAVSLEPKSLDVRLDLASALIREAQIPTAMAELREAARMVPSDPRPFILMADTYREHNQPYSAAEAFRQAIRVDPKRAQSYVGLADVLVFQVGRLPEAEELIRAASKLDPNDPVIQRGREVLAGARQVAEQELARRRSELRSKGDSAETRIAVGKAEALLGNNDAALEHFKRATALDPAGTKAPSDLAAIHLVRGEIEAAKAAAAMAHTNGSVLSADLLEAINRKMEWRFPL